MVSDVRELHVKLIRITLSLCGVHPLYIYLFARVFPYPISHYPRFRELRIIATVFPIHCLGLLRVVIYSAISARFLLGGGGCPGVNPSTTGFNLPLSKANAHFAQVLKDGDRTEFFRRKLTNASATSADESSGRRWWWWWIFLRVINSGDFHAARKMLQCEKRTRAAFGDALFVCTL